MNTSHKWFLLSVFSPQGKPRRQAAFCAANVKKKKQSRSRTIIIRNRKRERTCPLSHHPLPDYRVNQRKNHCLICAYTVCQHTGCIQISSPTTKNSPGISTPRHHHQTSAVALLSFHFFFFCFFAEDFKPLFSHTHIQRERRARSALRVFVVRKKW